MLAPMSPAHAIRQIVRDHARLAVDIDTLAEEADLYQAGLTSHSTVNLMLAIEDHFEIEFPERMLRRRLFESVKSILQAVCELKPEIAVQP